MSFPSYLAVAVLALAGGQLQTTNTPASSRSSVTGQTHGGSAGGHWSLPDASGPGHMVGRFFSHNGTALLEVHAQVLAPAAGASVGELHGVVSTLVGPNPGPIGELHGHWRLGAGPVGDFTAHIVRPGNPSTGTPPELIGGAEGHFLDPSSPLPLAGLFHGRWILHP